MGLWDTVLSTNLSGTTYNMNIPSQFKSVAQAVALNEYRIQPNSTWNLLANNNYYDRTRTHITGSRHWGGFPLESIGAASRTPGAIRIEQGFLGAHADIGGGYGASENSLSRVALNWMLGQAQSTGVKIKNIDEAVVPNNTAVIHDQSNAIRFGDSAKAPNTFSVNGYFDGFFGTNNYPVEDRTVNGAVSGNTQRTMGFGPPDAQGNRSMVNADTQSFITFTPRPPDINTDTRTSEDIAAIKQLEHKTGTVNMQDYMAWLNQHGYKFFN